MGLGLALLGLAWMYRKAQGVNPEPDSLNRDSDL